MSLDEHCGPPKEREKREGKRLRWEQLTTSVARPTRKDAFHSRNGMATKPKRVRQCTHDVPQVRSRFPMGWECVSTFTRGGVPESEETRHDYPIARNGVEPSTDRDDRVPVRLGSDASGHAIVPDAWARRRDRVARGVKPTTSHKRDVQRDIPGNGSPDALLRPAFAAKGRDGGPERGGARDGRHDGQRWPGGRRESNRGRNGSAGSAGVVRVEDSGGTRFPIPGPRVTVAQQALPRERAGSVAVVREYLCDGGRRRAKR